MTDPKEQNKEESKKKLQEAWSEWSAERRDFDVITGAKIPPIPEPKTRDEKLQESSGEWSAERRDFDVTKAAKAPPIPQPKTKDEQKERISE